MKKNKKIIWLDNPETHDFPAAADYLDLHFTKRKVDKLIKELKNATNVKKKAKDILRASQLPMLPKNNIHVSKNLKKVKNGGKLSPILLVRNENRLIIGDGYHRICAIYYLSEDFEIPCRIV